MDIEFQSTHPRGVRLLLNSNKCLSLCFNPRTHVGCDKNRVYATDIKDVSIHAPTWGATPCKRRPPVRYWFQSTHPRGVRLVTEKGITGFGVFQSTHPRGVRLIFSKYLNIILQKYINCEQHANF